MTAAQASSPRSWFIHGMLEDEHSWTPLLEQLQLPQPLAPRFPWSAQDEPYWGLQKPCADWLRDGNFAGAAPPNLIVAHSFGCSVAMEYLCEHPNKQPDLLVLVSPFWRARREAIDWPLLRHMIAGIDDLIGDSVRLADKTGRYAGARGRIVAERLRERLGVYGWVEFLKAFMRSPDLPLDRLACRTLVVAGRHDCHIPIESLDQLAMSLPSASLHVFEDGGHFTHITHAARLSSLISALACGAGSMDQLPEPQQQSETLTCP